MSLILHSLKLYNTPVRNTFETQQIQLPADLNVTE